ncbi:hypothetical protein BC826DRAFT_1042404, partial [Russula brevipes]
HHISFEDAAPSTSRAVSHAHKGSHGRGCTHMGRAPPTWRYCGPHIFTHTCLTFLARSHGGVLPHESSCVRTIVDEVMGGLVCDAECNDEHRSPSLHGYVPMSAQSHTAERCPDCNLWCLPEDNAEEGYDSEDQDELAQLHTRLRLGLVDLY